MAGHPNPSTDPLVRETTAVRRGVGVAQKKASPPATSRLPWPPLPPRLAWQRDWLQLTLAFACGGFRRSQLAGITVTDVEQLAEGLLVHLDRAKADQERKGHRVEIVYIPICGHQHVLHTGGQVGDGSGVAGVTCWSSQVAMFCRAEVLSVSCIPLATMDVRAIPAISSSERPSVARISSYS